MSGWRCGKWISSHFTIRLKYSTDVVEVDVPFILLVFFIPPFKALQALVKAQINAASAPIRYSFPFSTPSFITSFHPGRAASDCLRWLDRAHPPLVVSWGQRSVTFSWWMKWNGHRCPLLLFSGKQRGFSVKSVWAHLFIPNIFYVSGILYVCVSCACETVSLQCFTWQCLNGGLM